MNAISFFSCLLITLTQYVPAIFLFKTGSFTCFPRKDISLTSEIVIFLLKTRYLF